MSPVGKILMQRVKRQQRGLKNRRKQYIFLDSSIRQPHGYIGQSTHTLPSLLVTDSAIHAAFQENTPAVRHPGVVVGQ